ncbi:hypothetical protein F5876DRAFT_83182 [Lentinula aff. lateritia]|uniref:Uncharacterized protein n=1 Tax=Lentinula aff. lateritia TaxID=2804960 RepID=A0ACC1TIL6_9AGAR|nr:hypothetical protein F5876DRAFT_83182 [Lentinula aff. lateritia]
MSKQSDILVSRPPPNFPQAPQVLHELRDLDLVNVEAIPYVEPRIASPLIPPTLEDVRLYLHFLGPPSWAYTPSGAPTPGTHYITQWTPIYTSSLLRNCCQPNQTRTGRSRLPASVSDTKSTATTGMWEVEGREGVVATTGWEWEECPGGTTRRGIFPKLQVFLDEQFEHRGDPGGTTHVSGTFRQGLPVLKTFSKNLSWGHNGESRVKASWLMSSSSSDTAEGTPPCQTLIPTASSHTHYLTIPVPPQDKYTLQLGHHLPYHPRTQSEPPQLVRTSINMPYTPIDMPETSINMPMSDRHADLDYSRPNSQSS